MRSTHGPRLAVALAALAGALALEPAASAKPAETYIFLVSRVDLAKKDMPRTLEKQVQDEVTKAVEAHAELDGAMPAGAPDPEVKPKDFKSYLNKRKQRAFKVNVEVTDYERSVVPRDGRDQLLSVRVALRIFGETVPDRVMAFTGEGSATIQIEVGKTVRDKDRTYADQQAIEVAVGDAIATSIKKLREPPPSQKKKK
jgi:hypothetical protein